MIPYEQKWKGPMDIAIDNLQDKEVLTLLEEHLVDMHANSPAGSMHALDVHSLKAADITFWCAREGGEPVGCIAMKELHATKAEIKSMRTTASSRGNGVGTALLEHLLREASSRGYKKLSLETGSHDFFKPACTLYEKFGFEYCEPFGEYAEDPNSLFMELNFPA